MFVCLFVFFIIDFYLFRLRKPFVQREDVYIALCPEPVMVMNLNYLIRLQKKWNEKIAIVRVFSNYSAIYLSIPLYMQKITLLPGRRISFGNRHYVSKPLV